MVHQAGIRIDFEALVNSLVGDSELVRVYYYDAKPRDGALDGFLHKLRRVNNFEIRLGTLVECGERRMQKGVDGLLALDLTRLAMSASTFDNAVLIASDGDFFPAVGYARSLGVKIFCAYWNTASHNLRQVCDSTFQMSKAFLREIRFDGPRSSQNVQSALQPAAQPLHLWPAITRTAAEGATKVVAGEVVDVCAGASATVSKGGIVVARSGSSIHALKGATVYLHQQVTFTGTQGFELIPCASVDIAKPALKLLPQRKLRLSPQLLNS